MTCKIVLKSQLTLGMLYDPDDLKVLQETNLPEFQVRVYQRKPGTVQLRTLLKVMKEIQLPHDRDHFDLITSIPGSHMTNYYCSSCDETYDHKNKSTNAMECAVYAIASTKSVFL